MAPNCVKTTQKIINPPRNICRGAFVYTSAAGSQAVADGEISCKKNPAVAAAGRVTHNFPAGEAGRRGVSFRQRLLFPALCVNSSFQATRFRLTLEVGKEFDPNEKQIALGKPGALRRPSRGHAAVREAHVHQRPTRPQRKGRTDRTEGGRLPVPDRRHASYRLCRQEECRRS